MHPFSAFLRGLARSIPLALVLAAMVAIALGSGAGQAQAQGAEAKKFPPYPDLWQRTIPMAEWVVDESSLDVEAASDPIR